MVEAYLEVATVREHGPRRDWLRAEERTDCMVGYVQDIRGVEGVDVYYIYVQVVGGCDKVDRMTEGKWRSGGGGADEEERSRTRTPKKTLCV